ncbi:glutamate decarboxylase [Frondihabitans sp. PAMC 28766]|uniref:glutamate decarboxylase n=1 Tax=Frondihabitans sp. PAMC 28766 TaxID=1795630 RepID=UPI00078E366F|nr:glutamate decarboxylase [Frondihabitans sp. PAMC 28766]AMM21471.1 glutamate decarboxylase [Frondihabitans sp. PAMC 28766]
MTSPTDDPDTDVFASGVLERGAPKLRFPGPEQEPREVYQLVRDELLLDGVARMNLATFTTTWVEPEVRRLMAESLEKNIVDKDEYPQTAELETRCVHMLADLFHSPEAATTRGTSTTGSSEAAMLGGLAAKWRWKAHRITEGLPTASPNIVTGPVQVCWEKFARYFDVEMRQAPMNSGHVLTPAQVLDRVDENTIAVVVTFGQTFTGLFEDVVAISAALDDLQARTGLDVDIHVDAASGGFVAPFCAPDVVWDFRMPRVKSINVSGHKTGLAPLGSGWIVWRETADLPDELVFDVNYLGGQMPTFNLNFSRPGGQVISSYYNFVRLGREGYEKVQRACYLVAQHLAEGVEATGRFDIAFGGDPQRGIPAVAWTLRSGDGGADPAWNLFDLAEELRTRGWLVPAYTLPADQQEVVLQRIVVRHGLSVDMADLLLVDLAAAIAKLDSRPPSRSLAPGEGASFNHDATAAVPDGAPAVSRSAS